MNDVNGKANLEPTDGDRTGDLESRVNGQGATQDWKPRKIKVKGQEFVVDSREKELELLQKGADYERAKAELKEERRRAREEHALKIRELEPLLEIDQRLRSDPIKARKVQAILNDQPIPDIDDGETDDPYLARINRLERQNAQLAARIQGEVGEVRQSVGEFRRSRDFEQQERYLKKKFDWATDDDFEAARELAEAKGLDLVTAFKATAFDELPERVRRNTIQEFGVNEADFSVGRSEDIVLEGIGPISDPRTQARLYDDPDLYARFKPALRAARRARTGKQELVR